jgi:hypothetical protein
LRPIGALAPANVAQDFDAIVWNAKVPGQSRQIS